MSFDPDLPLLPPSIEMTDGMVESLAKTRESLAELNGFLQFFEDAKWLVQVPALQESVSSTQVENIETTVIGALEDSVKTDKDRQPGNKEALRYKAAIFAGLESMEQFALSNRTILKIHKTLNTTGAGRIREQQNAIQGEFSKPIYTPPSANRLNELLSNWENFVHNNKEFHPILRSIIAHYQFEAIHPFADGNGRTGRILMVLQLVNDKVLSMPAFYVSGYLKERSWEYKNLLLEVSEKGIWNNYLNFMLDAFSVQAIKTKILIHKIAKLKTSLKREIRKTLPKLYSLDLINSLFKFPLTYPAWLSEELGVTRKTASSYLKELERHNFLVSKQSGKYLLYTNHKLVDALHEKI